MESFLNNHLKSITEKELSEWIIRDSFKCFSSASNDKRLVQLGTMGNGLLAVCEHINSGMITYYFKSKHEAIEKYKKLLTE